MKKNNIIKNTIIILLLLVLCLFTTQAGTDVIYSVESLYLGSGANGEGNLTGATTIFANLTHINVSIECQSGNCSTMGNNWTVSNMTNATNAITFECDDTVSDRYMSAIFNVSSLNDTTPYLLNVSCEVFDYGTLSAKITYPIINYYSVERFVPDRFNSTITCSGGYNVKCGNVNTYPQITFPDVFSNSFFTWTGGFQNDIKLVGTYTDSEGDDLVDYPTKIFVLDDYLYSVSNTDHTFSIFDISGKQDPVPVGSYTSYSGSNTLYDVESIYVSGDYAYTVSADDNALVVWNISAKQDPIPVGNYSNIINMAGVLKVIVSGDYAYTIAPDSSNFHVFNISLNGDPISVGNYTSNLEPYSLGEVIDFDISGDFAYTLSYGKFIIWNISNYGDPIPISNTSLSISDYVNNKIDISGDFAYILAGFDDNLLVYNISNSSKPENVGSYTDSDGEFSLDYSRSLSISGNNLFVTSPTDKSISIFDISNNTDPLPLKSYIGSTASHNIFYLDNYIYTSGYAIGNIEVFDVTNILNNMQNSSTTLENGETFLASWLINATGYSKEIYKIRMGVASATYPTDITAATSSFIYACIDSCPTPDITIQGITDDLWITDTKNIKINFTITSPYNVSTAKLYGNWSAWSLNQTVTSIEPGVANNFNLLYLDDETKYEFYIWSNDSLGFLNDTSENINFGIDTIYPSLIVNNFTNNSIWLTNVMPFLNLTINETFIDRCQYTLYYRDTNTLSKSNVSISCTSENVTISVPSYGGGYSIYVEVIDQAGHVNTSETYNFDLNSYGSTLGGVLPIQDDGGGSNKVIQKQAVVIVGELNVSTTFLDTIYLNLPGKSSIWLYDIETNAELTDCDVTGNFTCSYSGNIVTVSRDFTNNNKLTVFEQEDLTIYSGPVATTIPVGVRMFNMAFYIPLNIDVGSTIYAPFNFFLRESGGIILGIYIMALVMIGLLGGALYYLAQ